MKIPSGRQGHLFGFVTLKHFGQKRKYNGDPYVNHVREVADMADGKAKFGYEIGLCHDLFEDTDCNNKELALALIRFGYTGNEAHFICEAVNELTDVFTHEAYPKINRLSRKKLEAERLHLVSAEAQTVKYCDLIHNTTSIVEYDRGFAMKYIPEKEHILQGMNKGHKLLYRKALQSLHDAKIKLGLD